MAEFVVEELTRLGRQAPFRRRPHRRVDGDDRTPTRYDVDTRHTRPRSGQRLSLMTEYDETARQPGCAAPAAKCGPAVRRRQHRGARDGHPRRQRSRCGP